MDIFHCSSYPSFWIDSLSLLPKVNFLSIGILERIPSYSHAGASSFSTGSFWGTMPCFCAGNMFACDWTEAKIRHLPSSVNGQSSPSTEPMLHTDRESTTALLRRGYRHARHLGFQGWREHHGFNRTQHPPLPYGEPGILPR